MSDIAITAAVFVVALLYSMVGHGGASGYLAILSLAGTDKKYMTSTSLLLNVLVASMSTVFYWRAGHMRWRMAIPFIVLSVPAAFIGAMMPISEKIYLSVLAAVLAYSAVQLGLRTHKLLEQREYTPPPLAVSLPVGGVLGLLSGIVGVGGGIFLSPLMLLKRWANPQETSATSALFIVVNSVAGIAGKIAGNTFEFTDCLHLIAAGFLGGLLGSHLGANKMSRVAICRVLAVVLLLAVLKLVIAICSPTKA